MDVFDAIVIGTGTSGQTAALELAAEGLNVAIIEHSITPGGVCALHGCQAKKYYYEVAEIMAKSAHLHGLGISEPPRAQWRDITAAKNAFTAQVPDNTVASLKGNGITSVAGTAAFLDSRRIEVDNRVLAADYFVIASGAHPVELPFAGSEHLLDSNDFLALDSVPQRLAFVGGGFISFEFAHFAARIGDEPREITILEAGQRPLGPFDRDMVVNGAGRAPSIGDLNLDRAGVDYSRRGITVDRTMRSSVATIFAVGDCADTIQLARVADREALVAARNICAARGDGDEDHISYTAVPSVLFSYPQLAMVGKTEEQLIADKTRYWKNMDTELSWPTYRRVGLAHAAFKILVDGDDRILGAHVLSDNATGIINTFRLAMLFGIDIKKLHQECVMSPYPSRESDITYMLSPLVQ